MNTTRQPQEQHIVSKSQKFVDTRSTAQYIFDSLASYDAAIITLFIVSVIAFMYPMAIPIVLLLNLIILPLAVYSRKLNTLPIKLPVQEFSHKKDFNQNKPGQRFSYENAQGVINIGNEVGTKKEVWATGADFLTHLMYIATTGGGKTDGLISLSSASTFTMGGGLCYVDAKAGAELIYQFAAIARITGREHHLRFISYRTGNKSVAERHWKKLSNTNSPFSHGNSEVCVQIIEGIMAEGSGDDAFFRNRGVQCLQAVFPAMVEMRDSGLVNISPSLIEKMTEFSMLFTLAYPEHHNDEIKFIDTDGITEIVLPNKLSLKARQGLISYLKGLPNLNTDPSALENPKEQPEQNAVQHGYGTGYFTKGLSNLAIKYGHIYQNEVGEADFSDCILQNRILIVMVPAVQDAKEERQTLGKINLSGIKVAMSASLGDASEGDVDDVIEKLPVDKKTPSMIIVDEYAEVAVPGFAVTATQGRGLGMACTFAGQDLAGFIQASKEETDMIFGSTRMKFLGTLLDVNETLDRFKKLAGSVDVAKSSGWQESKGMDLYDKNLATQIETIDRLDINDLTGLIEGEVKIFWRNKIIDTNLFHYGVDFKKAANNFRFNRLLSVLEPSDEEKQKLTKQLKSQRQIVRSFEKAASSSKPVNEYFASINIDGQSDDWIYQHLKKKTTKAEQEKIKNQDVDVTETTTSPELDTTNAEKPTENIDINEQSLDDIFANSTVGEVQKESEDEKQDRIVEETVTDLISALENDWIFKFASNKGKTPRAQELHDGLSDLLSAVGIDKDTSSKKAIKTITQMTDAARYTTIEVTPKETHKDLFWDAIDALEDED